MIIGLDWDDTITEYTKGLRKLVECATEVHIITLNTVVTEVLAKSTLEFDGLLQVHIMPEEEFDMSKEHFGIGEWKAKIANKYGVELMIDDMQEVVAECLKIGIPAIQVQVR